MTDREKAIVMAHTGICMLTGNKFQIFHKYVEDIMGRPVWTHEMALDSIADEIKAKSKDDFIALCADESSSEKPNKWIPVSERLPEEIGEYLVTQKASFSDYIYRSIVGYALNLHDVDEYDFADKKRAGWYEYDRECGYYEIDGVIAWMPLPDPYKVESEDKE